jgi:hypothetical protein
MRRISSLRETAVRSDLNPVEAEAGLVEADAGVREVSDITDEV